jgi:hypothetical protein
MVEELATRFEALAGKDAALTLVCDADQDSQANQTKVALSGLHFVGSLPPCDHSELISVIRSRCWVVDEAAFGGLTYFDTTKNVLGTKYRLVVTHSENPHQKRSRF